MRKYKKTLLITFGLILVLAITTIIFISPIAKYLIEKYDEKYTGRQITLDMAYVNPFTGYIHLSNVYIKESKSDSLFIFATSINANFEMRKLFSKNFEISELELIHPNWYIKQNGDKHDINFKDIIERFTQKKDHKVKHSPTHFTIQKIVITDGVFHYFENIAPINYFIKNVNIESTGIHWDSDTIAFKYSFLSGIGDGNMKGDFTINTKTKDYQLSVIANKFNLKVLEQYIKDITNYGSFFATLDADLKAEGNFKNKEDITIKGMFAINDFHFGKNAKEDYTSFDKLLFTIQELSPKNHKYIFDSIALNHPYFKYERYDHIDNIQAIFGKKGSKIVNVTANPEQFNLVIEIAKYVKVLVKNFFRSNYEINRLAIYDGDLKFNDYSLSEKFSAELNPLYFIADSINRKYKRVNVVLRSDIKPYGNLAINLSVNPKDSSDFDIRYKFQKIPTTMFNPYLITYTSFPLDRGTVEIHGNWHVKNGIVQSNNHLILLDPRLSSRIRNKDANWIPMRLLMYFIRERGNVIDYEIPITGNLKDPKFHLRDVLIDALENVFVKPVTTPYRVQVKNLETEIEKTLSLSWPMRSIELSSTQEKFIDRISDFLVENPDARINIYPQNYTAKEKEYILFFEAKKKYFREIHHKTTLTENDLEEIDEMSVKDSLFVSYLNKQNKKDLLFTIQDKCLYLIDSSIITEKFNQLTSKRINIFMNYFKEKKVDKQVKIHPGNQIIPYNGFSFYNIKYANEFPEALINAYKKMNDLNDLPPRKRFQKARGKSRKI